MATTNSNLEVVLVGWIDARRRNDVETLKRHLDPNVVWQGVRADLVWPDRGHVLENVRAAAGRLPQVEGIELTANGDQVLFGVRSPDLTEIGGEILDGELYNVFTIRDGLIVRMDEFKTREAAAEASARRDTCCEPRLLEVTMAALHPGNQDHAACRRYITRRR